MDKIKSALTHAFKVGGYITTSIVLLGLYAYFSNQESVNEFTKYLTDFGIPAAVVNIIISGIKEYMKNAKKPSLEE